VISDPLQFAATFLAGLLAGNELGTLVAIHPALRSLDLEAQVVAEQAVTRRYGVLMPPLMIFTLILGIAASVAADSDALRLNLAATLAIAVMIAITLAGNVPINSKTLAFSGRAADQRWQLMRRRWERLHIGRVLLDLAAFACFLLTAL
jgi:Na+/H+-dicarboxylate symporter